MTISIYRNLWNMTSQSKARNRYGWYQVYRRLGPWAIPAVPAFVWMAFVILPDDLQDLISLGFYKRNLYWWDTRLSGGSHGWYL